MIETEELAKLTVAYRNKGVVAFAFSGFENFTTVSQYSNTFEYLKK